jgi:hypothetical protein
MENHRNGRTCLYRIQKIGLFQIVQIVICAALAEVKLTLALAEIVLVANPCTDPTLADMFYLEILNYMVYFRGLQTWI